MNNETVQSIVYVENGEGQCIWEHGSIKTTYHDFNYNHATYKQRFELLRTTIKQYMNLDCIAREI